MIAKVNSYDEECKGQPAAGFLWKIIRDVLNNNKMLPGWFVEGRTVLIPKEGCVWKLDQYQPITCLNTGYKLFTAGITTLLQQHVDEHSILLAEQKALHQGRCGCLNALVVDSMVIEEAHSRKKGLPVAWIDYRKSYDRVSHGWLSIAILVM